MKLPLPLSLRAELLGKGNSRCNKLWCVIAWEQKFEVAWRWAGEAMRSRLEFAFDGGRWQTAKSFDQDVVPLFDDPVGKRRNGT